MKSTHTHEAARIAYLDGWRGLAILALLVGHFLHLPGINFGTIGVNLFFVLSGFLMARILFLQAVPLGLFYKRRISRIFPATYVFLLLMLLIYFPTMNPAFYGDIPAAFGFYFNYLEPHKFSESGYPIGHLWSLCVEEHSYILLSLVALCTRRYQLSPKKLIAWLMCVNIVLIFVYLQLFHWSESKVFLRSETRSFSILISAFFALHFHEHWQNRQASLTAALGLVAVGILSHWWSVPAWFSQTCGIGAIALGFVMLSRVPQHKLAWLSHPLLTTTGLVSFSVYLWQQPFYYSSLPVWIGLPLAAGAGYLSYRFIEGPCRSFLNRYW